MRARCLIGCLCALLAPWAAAADEAAPKVVMISMTFDASSAPLGAVVTGHITITDSDGNPASLDDDLTVTVSCDLLGLAVVTQPQTIAAGASSADFTVEPLGLPLLGRLLPFTADLGIYGADHASISIRGLWN